jgi:hypothetical protein
MMVRKEEKVLLRLKWAIVYSARQVIHGISIESPNSVGDAFE